MPVQRISWIYLRVLTVGAFAMLSPEGVARAQFGPFRREGMVFEIRPRVGALIPTGGERAALQSAALGGLQMSVAVVPRLALTLTFAAAPSKDLIRTADQAVDVIQYDLGGEWRWPDYYRLGGWHVMPFAGAGLGSRMRAYSDTSTLSETNTDGYGALGGEVEIRNVGLRVEARDYFSPSSNSVAVSLGVSFHLGGIETQQPKVTASTPDRHCSVGGSSCPTKPISIAESSWVRRP
jgi:hypothetical protein